MAQTVHSLASTIGVALAGLIAVQAMAQTVPPLPDAVEDITPDEWRDMVRGRTVTYRIGQDFWAREAYDRGTNQVAIRLADGTCMEGIWSWADGEYCFAWSSGELSCFRHVRSGDEILIIPLIDGAPGGTIQVVDGVSDVPLACGPALTS